MGICQITPPCRTKRDYWKFMEIKREHVWEGSKQFKQNYVWHPKTKFQYSSPQYPRLQSCFQITIEGSTLDYFLNWPFVRFPGHTSLQIKERRPKGAKYCLSLEAWRCVRHDSVDSVSHFPRPGLQVTRPHIGCRACPETGEATWQPGDNQNICSNIFFDRTCILWYVAPMCSVFEQFWSRFLSCIHFGHFCHWNRPQNPKKRRKNWFPIEIDYGQASGIPFLWKPCHKHISL